MLSRARKARRQTPRWQGVDSAGERLYVRPAERRDAPRLVDHMGAIVCETPFMLQGPDDRKSDTTAQREIIGEMARRDNALCLLALREPRRAGRASVLGHLTLVGGRSRRTLHVAELAMGVRRAVWGRGIGSRLLDLALTWVRDNPILERVSLTVYADNLRAIALYERLGFVHEGVQTSYARLPDGRFVDLVGMGFVVEPPL